MTNKSRFVFDTNVIVSAVLLPGNKPDLAIRKAQNLGIILMSPATWAELEQVLSRPKFNRYITIEERQRFLIDLSETATLLREMTDSINICRDSKDNKYLELAVSGKAEAIITGDEDLLVLNPFRGLIILTPQELLLK